jgi:hypothetical protein
VEHGIVVEPEDDTFWFGHALVADAVQQQLLGRERRRLHERSLTALRGPCPSPTTPRSLGTRSAPVSST